MTVKELLQDDVLQERLMFLIKQEAPVAHTWTPPIIDRIELFYDDIYDEFHSIERQQGEQGSKGMLYLGSIKAMQLDFPQEDLNNVANDIFDMDYDELLENEEPEVLDTLWGLWHGDLLDEEWDDMLKNVTRDVIYHEEHDV